MNQLSGGYSHRVSLLPSDSEISIDDILEMLDRWGSLSEGSSNCAPDNEKNRTSVPVGNSTSNLKPDSSTPKIAAKGKRLPSFSPLDKSWPHKLELRTFHFNKIDNASLDEINFCLLVRNHGPIFAIKSAVGFGWDCERPLNDLREIQRKRVASQK